MLTDTIDMAFTGWMQKDLKTSFNYASLALWRSEQHGLWLSAEEDLFLNNVLLHPPVTRKARRKG